MALNLGELFGTIGLDSSEWDAKLQGAQGSLKTFGVAGAAIAGAAAVAIGAALTKGIADSMNIEAGTDKLQASLGLTEEQAGTAGRAAGSLFAANYGESMDDVNLAVEAVMSSIKGMRDASDADVEAMTAKMMNLSTVMGVDVARASQVAGQMITSGLAKDGGHAADLLTTALQNVPAAVREDILDATDEYGPFFAQIGISGDKAMSLLVKSSEKGMYGIDKTGDALKEFTLLTTTADKGAVSAFDSIGLNAEDMARAMAEGGPKAAEALQSTVDGLQAVQDPAKKAQLAIDLFGTPLEDLGTNGIPGFLTSLDSTEAGFGDVAGAADKMGQDLTSNAKSGFDGFVRQGQAALIDFVQANIMPSVSQFATFLNNEVGPAITNIAKWIDETALPALSGFADWFTANLPEIQNWATGIAVIMLPLFIKIAIGAAVSAAAQVVAWATAAGGAIKTAAVYVAQAYIMIGRWVAMGIAATVNAAVIVAGWVAMAVGATVNAVKMAAAWVVGVLIPAVGGAIAMGINAALVVGAWVLMGIQSMIQAGRMALAWFIALGPVGWVIAAVIGLVAIIIANWDSIVKFTTDAFTNIGNFLRDTWNNIVNWVTGAINNVSTTISSVVSGILSTWNRFWGDVGAKVGSIWESIKTGVSTGIENVVTFVKELPGKVLGVFANAGTLLKDAGGNIIEGFLSGLKAGFENVKNFIGGIGEWIAKNKGPKAYDLKLLIPAGGWIMDGLDKGLKAGIPGLKDTLGNVSATIASGVTGGTVGLAGVPGNVPAGTTAAAPSGGVVNNWHLYEQSDPAATAMNVARRQAALRG